VHDVALTTDRVIASLVRSLGDGWLLNLTVTSGATSSPYGATFARVQVVRGLAGSGIVLGTLCAGYVTSAQPIAFPGGRVRSMIEGRGNIRSITGTNPAAGVDWAETVPTGVRWRLLALTATLATDATAANRQARFGFTDGAANLYRSDAPNNQTASTSVVYNAGHGTARIAMVSDQPGWGLPTEMFLLAGYTIFSATGSIQAGDNWGAPQLLVEEFLDAN